MNNPKFNPNIENLYEGQAYIKNAFDKEAYQLYQKPYGALNPAEQEQAKKICSNPPVAVDYFSWKNAPEPTPKPQPSKPTNPTTETQKETYLLQKQVEQAEANQRLIESQQRHELKKQVQQLEIQIRTMQAGQERAEALKKLYELKTGNRLTNANP